VKPGSDQPLILASNSPRRKDLLSRLNTPFKVQSSGVEEVPLSGESPDSAAIRLAYDKAFSVANKHQRGIVIGADTVIDLDGKLLGKPVNKEDAFLILEQISGCRHFVITGIAVIDLGCHRTFKSSVKTEVRMNKFGVDEIEKYIDSGEPMDKAGAYAIQGIGGDLVRSISGCYNNVVGFPLCEIIRILHTLDYGIPENHVPCQSFDGSPCPRNQV
jgi:septum formation protein